MTAEQTDRRGPERAPATILVVDDSTAVRRILRRALESGGYRVEEAANGLEGVAATRAHHPDLVLLDVDMPVMDGMTALAELRADPAVRSIPVLFLTARTGGADVAHGLDLGAQDYLRKPCEPVELHARVAAALRNRDREVELDRRAREADELSTRDPLTGLGNRRFLASLVDALAGRGADAVAGVLLLDVDHFKKVNDDHGHQVGDTVLRILARRAAGAVEAEATVVRWGGEEFLALVAGASPEHAAALAERIRAAVSATPFAVDGGRQLGVTVSVGCAVGPVGSFDDVVASADSALYEAKRSGRNRVTVAAS